MYLANLRAGWMSACGVGPAVLSVGGRGAPLGGGGVGAVGLWLLEMEGVWRASRTVRSSALEEAVAEKGRFWPVKAAWFDGAHSERCAWAVPLFGVVAETFVEASR